MSEWIYGTHAVEAVLRAKKRGVTAIGAVEPAHLSKPICAEAAQRKIPIKTIAFQTLTDRCPGAHRHDPVVEAEPYSYAALSSIIEAKPTLILALDQVQDPHNVGALLRSAYALGAKAVLLSKDRSVGITPAVVRTSAGASEFLPICVLSGLPQQLSTLKKKGWWIVGADAGGVSVQSCKLWGEPMVLVMGAEGEGLRQTTTQVCDQLVSIPIRSNAQIDSLNVSVAGGILMWEAAKAMGARNF